LNYLIWRWINIYIDIRSKRDYIKGHIDGAINIESYDLLLNHKSYLKKNNVYYIYCNNGFKSKIMVNKLNTLGYNCVNVDGGYNNYLLKVKKI
jgi:rhodanese-related sulfurtransferase